MTNHQYDHIQESVLYIKSKVNTQARTAIVLGTGLGGLVDKLDNVTTIPYSELPHFPISTVDSHAGQLLIGTIHHVSVIVMAGRFHYYEGYSAHEVTFPIRVLKALGIEDIILTNASGGLNPHYHEGEIVCITDHINMAPDHPLRGPNDDRLGVRFPDMLHAYNKDLRDTFTKISGQIGLKLKHGIYLCLQGPSLETPAEYRMARILGADVLGMSTVPEVIVANHAGMRICVFSIVSNVCFPSSNLSVTTLEEVIQVVSRSALKLVELLDKYFESTSQGRQNEQAIGR
jgi:purine-nucleoside phosphorylase